MKLFWRDCVPDSPQKFLWYKIYTDLAYKTAVGMDAAHVRKSRGAAKDANAVECLTSDEMETVEKASGQIAVLIEAGMDYAQIRDILQNKRKAAESRRTDN